MATVTAFSAFDNSVLPWNSGFLAVALPETFTIQVSPGPDYLVFEGDHFDYGGTGPSGTVSAMQAQDGDGVAYYRIDNVAWSASQVAQLFVLGMHAQLLALMYADNDQIFGSGDNDTILGYAGNDTINGQGGSDDLRGGTGDDLYFAGVGDTVTEVVGEGLDEVRSTVSFTLGTAEIETLTLLGSAAIDGIGNSRANVIRGNSGDNVLSGQKGADWLTGGLGHDVLRGGIDTARDRFVFNATAESGTGSAADVITGFASGTDKIILTEIDANALTGEPDAFFFSGTTALAFSVWYKVTSYGIKLSLDTSGDLIADMEIKLNDLTSIAASDILL